MARAMRVCLVVTFVTVAVLAFGVPVANAKFPTGPEGDAFYQPRDPLPKEKAGTLIRAQPMDAPQGVLARAWRVLYHSRSVHGDDIVVSGMVVVPYREAPKGGRTIVSWAHGTTGTADVCVPSKADDPGSIPFLADLLDANYIVVATDYEGLGPPGLHPYLVGESEGRGVLDVARAARQLPIHAGRDLLVYGHSQGGHAALFAGELAASYAPDLNLLGVMAGAPPADLETILAAAGAIPATAGFLAQGVAGFHAAYPNADPADVLTPAALDALPITETACSGEVGRVFAALGAVDAHPNEDVPPWPKLLHKNSAGYRDAGAPLLVVQGSADPLVVQPVTDAWVKKACARGDVIDYRVYQGADHVGSLFAARDDIFAFFKARVEGEKPTSTCGEGSATG